MKSCTYANAARRPKKRARPDANVISNAGNADGGGQSNEWCSVLDRLGTTADLAGPWARPSLEKAVSPSSIEPDRPRVLAGLVKPLWPFKWRAATKSGRAMAAVACVI